LTWRETPRRWVPHLILEKNQLDMLAVYLIKHWNTVCPRICCKKSELKSRWCEIYISFFPFIWWLNRLVNWNSLHAPMKPVSVTRKASGRTRTSHWSASETWTSPGSRDWTTRTASFGWC
jgi:hypothetical protein